MKATIPSLNGGFLTTILCIHNQYLVSINSQITLYVCLSVCITGVNINRIDKRIGCQNILHNICLIIPQLLSRYYIIILFFRNCIRNIEPHFAIELKYIIAKV